MDCPTWRRSQELKVTRHRHHPSQVSDVPQPLIMEGSQVQVLEGINTQQATNQGWGPSSRGSQEQDRMGPKGRTGATSLRDPTRKNRAGVRLLTVQIQGPAKKYGHRQNWRQAHLQLSPGKSWRPRAALKLGSWGPWAEGVGGGPK